MQTQIKARKSLLRKACPRCGGDVCRNRDTFGVYHQCVQCGREFRQTTMPTPTPTIEPAIINASSASNPTEHKEPLMV